MCAIIGSFDKQILIKLIERNQHRGRVAYSISTYDIESGDVKTYYERGEFNHIFFEKINTDGKYTICHLLSPTLTENDEEVTHPSVLTTEVGESCLWHNGVLLPSTMEMIQQNLGSQSYFDTYLLHQWIDKGEKLDDIEGSFACLYITQKKQIQLFRSKHAKLFIDEDMTISSERFEGSRCINPDCFYNLDLEKKSLKVEGFFKTKRFNIYIKGEMDD